MKSRKVVFIGIDAMDPELLQQWSGEGYLPTFSRLLNNSFVAPTLSPNGLYVGGIWPSFATSCSPARHLSYCFRQLRLGTYDDLPTDPEDLKRTPFWEYLSQAGKRVAIIDLPRVPLSRGINGIHLADWCAHDPIYPAPVSWPTELAAQIADKYGSCKPVNCDSSNRDAGEFTLLRDQLIDRSQRKLAASLDLFQREDWDFFATTFSEAHCAGHQCWHIHDEQHERHTPALRAAVGDPIREVYVAIDRQLGSFLAQLPDDRTVFVLASHGMGPHYDGTYLLDTLLQRMDGIKPSPGARSFAALHRYWQKLPQRLRGGLHWLDGARKHQIRSRLLARDRAARQYFAVSNNDATGGIRINLIGREPDGKVQSGEQFERVCAELIQNLLQLNNAETGEPLVKEVFFTRDHHAGPYLEHLPDLLIEWNRAAPISEVHSPLVGTVKSSWQGVRSGDHKAGGMLLVTGPGISARQFSQPVNIIDIGASIAELMGVQLGEVDGKPVGMTGYNT